MNSERTELRALVHGTVGVVMTLVVILLLSYGSGFFDALRKLAAVSSMLLTGTRGFASIGGGFSANVFISLGAMAVAMVLGIALGVGLISEARWVRESSRLLMNFLRNSPWLVILYAMLYLIPFQVDAFGVSFELAPTAKAIMGLSLPISANLAEVFRGGVRSIPLTQWEASRALGYSRMQTLYEIIFPQALPIMIPGVMTVYASLFIGTSLVVVTGTNDVLSVARVIIESGASHYQTAIYIFVLCIFFLYAFPIAMASRWLERRARTA